MSTSSDPELYNASMTKLCISTIHKSRDDPYKNIYTVALVLSTAATAATASTALIIVGAQHAKHMEYILQN